MRTEENLHQCTTPHATDFDSEVINRVLGLGHERRFNQFHATQVLKAVKNGLNPPLPRSESEILSNIGDRASSLLNKSVKALSESSVFRHFSETPTGDEISTQTLKDEDSKQTQKGEISTEIQTPIIEKEISNLDLEELINNIVISAHPVINLSHTSEDEIQKAFFEFLSGEIPHNKKLLFSAKILTAIFWRRDPEVLSQVKKLICNILLDIYGQIESKVLTPEQILHVELIINELLALYPFLGPKKEEQIFVPFFFEGKLQLIDYSVDTIQLTPSYMGSPIKAVGLKPLNLEFPAIVINKGTTYFADYGCSLSLLTDLNPFAGVGAYLFWLFAKPRYEKWLKENTTKEVKAIVIGKSLGGALSMFVGTYLPEYVQRVFTTGAPGMHGRDVEVWNKLGDARPKADAFVQEDDLIPFVDAIATEGVNFYKVLGERETKGIFSHAMVFSTQKESLIMKLDPSEHLESIKRKISGLFKNPVCLVGFSCLLFIHVLQTLAQETYHLLRYRKFVYFTSGDVED